MITKKMFESEWREALERQERCGLLRTLHRSESDALGKSVLDFTMNDYLGLSRHPEVLEGAMQALKTYGAGCCSSRLLGGGYGLIEECEQQLAEHYGKEKALLFPSGYQANVSSLSALLKRSDLVVADKYIHRSLVDGIALSGAKLIRYRHADLEEMERVLEKQHKNFARIICVTESVFSMHGTRSNLALFCQIAARFGALTFVDDAHGFGVFSEGERQRMTPVTVVMTTLSKGIGVQGGALVGSAELIHYLVNYSGGFIYTTSLAPPIVGAALTALKLLPSLDTRRSHLDALSKEFSCRVRGLMPSQKESDSHIQPIYGRSAEQVMEWKHCLQKKKISVAAIRAPTVPANQALIRCSLTADHTSESLDCFFKELERLCAR